MMSRRHPTRDLSVLHTDPSIHNPRVQLVLFDNDLARAASPIGVASVARVAIKADVQAVATTRKCIGESFGPFHAPVHTMIVTGEYSHKSLGLDKRRHEWNVGTAVPAIVSCAVAYIALLPYALFVKARVRFAVTPVLLERSRCMNWNVHKCHTRNWAAILLRERVVGVAEPFNDLQELASYQTL